MFEYRPVETPYPGLRPFEAYESEIFFGREGHTDRLLEILQRERFLAVIGPSGCGKSSLVRAGLLPGLASGALGTGSDWRLAVLRPGGEPFLALAQALLAPHALGRELLGKEQLPKDADDITADAALIAAELRCGPDRLAGLVRTAAEHRSKDSDPFNLLVLVDQFEELFTYASAVEQTEDESEAFVEQLLAARANQESRIHVAITMRTDFLGQCVRFLPLPEAINRAQYLTPRLNSEELRSAIVGPARVFGGDVDEELTAELIKNIRADSDQLPVLQHALARMWWIAIRDNCDSPLIDADSAKAVGGVAGALNTHADEVFHSLGQERQIVAEKIFRAITERRESGGQDVRRPQKLAAIAEWGSVEEKELSPVIEAFAAPEVSFLHYGRELNEKSVIDLNHEALIRKWELLQNWVGDEFQRGQAYRRWSHRAKEYEKGVGSLLVGGDLARALDWWNPDSELQKWQPDQKWARRYNAAKDSELKAEFERTRQYLIESRDAEQREREAEQKRLEAEAAAERQRADKERELANQARAGEKRARQMSWVAFFIALSALAFAGAAFLFKLAAQSAEQQRTTSLFESQLTHASLLARVEDYAEARRVLRQSAELDSDIPESRRHARNLLAGYVDIMGGEAEQVYEGAGAALIGGVTISPDGKLLAAAGERGTLVLFDTDSGKLRQRLEGHNPDAEVLGTIRGVVFDPKGRWMYSGGDDGRIIRWSLPEGDKLDEWDTPERVWALAVSPDGKTLASGDRYGRITLWSVDDGSKIRTLKEHARAIGDPNGLVFSEDGNFLASASYDRTARIWDWRKGESLLTLDGHVNGVKAVAFSPDGKLLATASDDKQVILWDAESGEPLRALRGHHNMVFDVAFVDEGRGLLSASRDNTLRLWDMASGTTRRIYRGHQAALTSVIVIEGHVYTAAHDATVRRWALDAQEQWLWEIKAAATSTAISLDGRVVAVGLQNGGLHLFSTRNGTKLFEANDAHDTFVTRVAFSVDGRLLATSSQDNTAKIWSLEWTKNTVNLDLLYTIDGHNSSVHSVTFSPDGTRLATASFDGQIGLFDKKSGGRHLFPAHEGRVASVSFNQKGDRLLSAGNEDRRVRLWNLKDPDQAPQEIAQAQDELLWAILSPDGRKIAVVGREFVVSLYDLDEPSAPRRLVGHESTVFRAIYSPDGRQLATVSSDMTVRLWDLDNLRLLFTIRLPTQREHGVPLWDFDFRCTEAGECWIAVPLTVGRLALYRLPYANPPASITGASDQSDAG